MGKHESPTWRQEALARGRAKVLVNDVSAETESALGRGLAAHRVGATEQLDHIMDNAIRREVGILKREMISHGRFMALLGFILGVLVGLIAR